MLPKNHIYAYYYYYLLLCKSKYQRKIISYNKLLIYYKFLLFVLLLFEKKSFNVYHLMCQSSANEVSIFHVLPNLNLVPLSRYLDKRSYNLAHLLRKILGSRALNRNKAESALYIHAMALDSRPSCSI